MAMLVPAQLVEILLKVTFLSPSDAYVLIHVRSGGRNMTTEV